jgi:hypothetical protein
MAVSIKFLSYLPRLMILATGSRRKALEIAETWKQYSGRKFFGFFPVDSYQLPVLSDRNRPETIKTINRFTSYIYEEENDGLAVYLDEPASFMNLNNYYSILI